MKKRILAMFLCLIMVAAVVVGCGTKTPADPTTKPSDAPEPTEEPKEMVYRDIYAVEVTTLNYLTTSQQWDQQVAANVIDSLVEFDNHSRIIPGLATEWSVSEDNLVWTFKIRQGVKWYDNTGAEVAELTANDFVSAAKYALTAEYDSKTCEQLYMVKNAEKYYNLEITDFAEVGVSAPDDYTLVYTLERPTPYFLTALPYVCYFPAYGPQLEELKSEFGLDNTKLYFCGAYILDEYEPQVRHTYVKNENNWDAEKIYITRIERTYVGDASTVGPTMVLRDEIDYQEISSDIITEWKANNADYLSKGRVDPAWTYFYTFNFRPTYDESYNPGDWAIAVQNINFRRSIQSGLNRRYAVEGAYCPDDPEGVMVDTFTPRNFANVNGTDFADMPAFANVADNFYNEEKALAFKATAMTELQALGVTFPLTVLITYRSDDKDWENESVLVKQQLETLLGTDYIKCELFAAPADNFLAETRRAGKYSLMRCNWGADYLDPQTFTDPFSTNIDADTKVVLGNTYNRMDLVMHPVDYKGFYTDAKIKSVTKIIDKLIASGDFTATGAMLKSYYDAVDAAINETSDLQRRFELFAEAEAMLMNNAIVVPMYASRAKNLASKLNIFEGQYAASGISQLRFKGQKVYDEFTNAESQAAFKAAWEAEG